MQRLERTLNLQPSRLIAFLLGLVLTTCCLASNPEIDAAMEDFGAALAAGDETKVEELISRPGFVTLIDKDGHDALFAAAFFGRVDIAERLVQGGADIRRRDAVGSSALHFAVMKEQTPMVRWLLERGAEISSARSTSPLQAACIVGNAEIAAILIEAGARLFTNLPAKKSSDALDATVIAGHDNVLRVLLASPDIHHLSDEELQRLKQLAANSHHGKALAVLEEFEASRKN